MRTGDRTTRLSATTLALVLVALCACSRKHPAQKPDAGDAGGSLPDAGADRGPDRITSADADAGSVEAPPDAAADLESDGADAGDVEGPATACGAPSDGPLGSIVPLFAPGDAKMPPIVSIRQSDGAILTRGAGRLHARHENEQPYVPYMSSYWEGLSYAFVVEDFTATLPPHIRVTYLPVYKPFKTLWKAWKTEGNNSTFQHNLELPEVATAPVVSTAAVGGIQQIDETMTVPPHTFEKGKPFEFEFNVIKDAGGSINPFSDIFRYRIGMGGLTPDGADRTTVPAVPPESRLGGDTTIAWLANLPEWSFDQMALNTQQENVQKFLEGRRLFYTSFATGENVEVAQPGIAAQPPFPEQAGKLGPLSNATTCVTCHARNGGGATLAGTLGPTSSMVFRLTNAGALGQQLQLQEGAAASGTPTAKTVTLADGTVVALHTPTFTVTAGAGGAPPLSARVARPLPGLGLLEAIDERVLLARADRVDCDKDGVTGRPNLVKDPVTGALRVGRFGWKAEKASVEHQVADDAAESMGVGSSVIKDPQGNVDLSDADVARLTTFARLLGVPAQRKTDDPEVKLGAVVFQRIGCHVCHVRDAVTSANHPFAELRGQAIKPYTDLLLHDMGPDLADASGVPQPVADDSPASASEWRTPPLWGIGLRQMVNGNAGLLHDGRAADVQEAILWHGGEATPVKNNYIAIPAADRAALLAFLQSL